MKAPGVQAASSTGAAPPAATAAEQSTVSMDIDAGGQQALTPASGEEAPTPVVQYRTREELEAAEMEFLSKDWIKFQRARPAKDIASANRLAPQERVAPSATPSAAPARGVQQAPAPALAGAEAPTPKGTNPFLPLQDEDLEEDSEPPTLIQDMLTEIEDDEAWDALQREKEDAWRHHFPPAWAQTVDGLLDKPYDDLKPFLRVWRHLAQHLNIQTGKQSSDWARRPRDSQWEAVESRIWAIRKAIRDAAWGSSASWANAEERDRQCGRDKADLLSLTHELMKPGEGPKGFVPEELTEDGFQQAMEEIGREWADRHYALMKEAWDRGLHSKEMKATVPLLLVAPLSEKPTARRPPEVDAMDFNLWIDAILGHAELRRMQRVSEPRGAQQQQPKRVDTPRVRSPVGGATPLLSSQASAEKSDRVPQVRVSISAKEWRSAEAALEEYLLKQVARQRYSEAERELGARPKEQRQKQRKGTPHLPAPPVLRPGPEMPQTDRMGQTPAVPTVPPVSATAPGPPPAEAPPAEAPKPLPPKAPLSYAKAAAKQPSAEGAGGASGGSATGAKQQQQQQGRSRSNAMPGRVPNWEDILAEDDSYLQNFFADYPGEKDPDQRYVVRLTYVGNDPRKLGRKYIESEVIEKALGFTSLEVWALVTPMGTRDADLCFRTEKDYRHFWAKLREAREADPSFLTDFHLTPIFRCDIKVVTVFFRNTAIPEEDVGKWLEQRCEVLKFPERSYDVKGYFTGEFKAVIRLWREKDSGFIKHVPKYFYLGADRGATRYSGQPMACFQCGGWRHVRSQCKTSMCARCSAPGHRTSDCAKPSVCNLCGQRGHEYKLCPEAYNNICNPERYAKQRAEAEERGLYKDQSDSESEEPVRGAEAPSTSAQEEQWKQQRSRRRKNKAKVIARTAEGTGVPPSLSPQQQQQQEAAPPKPPQQSEQEVDYGPLSPGGVASVMAALNSRQRRKEERRQAGLDKKYQAKLAEEQQQRLRDLEEVKRQLEQKLQAQQAQETQGGTEAEEESDMEVTTPSRKRRSEAVASRLSPPETVQKVQVKETVIEALPAAEGEEVQCQIRTLEEVIKPTPVPSPVPSPAQAPAPSVAPTEPETKEPSVAVEAEISVQQEVIVQKTEIKKFVFKPTLSPPQEEQQASIRREAKVFRFQASAWTSDSGYGSDPPPPPRTPAAPTPPKASTVPQQQDQQAQRSSLEAVPEEEQQPANPFDGVSIMSIGRKKTSVGKVRKVIIPGLPKKQHAKKAAPKGDLKAAPQVELAVAVPATATTPALHIAAAADGRTVPPDSCSSEQHTSSLPSDRGEDSETT